MAIPNSGTVTSAEVYEEYHGDGATPAGSYSLEQIQADWGLPETPDNTDIFAGKGRPEADPTPPVNLTANSAEVYGNITNAGGFTGAGDCDWRILFENANPPTVVEFSGTVAYSFTGNVGGEITGLSSSTTYYYRVEVRNNFDSNNWQQSSVASFTTP